MLVSSLMVIQMIRGTLTAVVHNFGIAVVLMSEVVHKRLRNNCLNNKRLPGLISLLSPHEEILGH